MSRIRFAKRLFDRRPLACHLYVTDRCNLDCHYCAEYDNSARDPDPADLKRYATKAHDLGCLHIGLQGGEPLLYPYLGEIVRHCRELGMTVSLSTNGFLLNREVVRNLEREGLNTMQVSVDRMTPAPATRKSLKTVAAKLEALRGTSIKVQVAGVLFGESIEEARDVLDATLAMGFASHFRLVHPDPRQDFRVDVGDRKAMRAFIQEMMGRKAAGERIHTTWTILNYQLALLNGRAPEWSCTAGYKYFFVSSQGKFWPCSMLRSDIDFMGVTAGVLRTYDRKKECQRSCGVYCVVSTSMLVNDPVRFGLAEAGVARKGKAVRAFGEGFLGIESPERA